MRKVLQTYLHRIINGSKYRESRRRAFIDSNVFEFIDIEIKGLRSETMIKLLRSIKSVSELSNAVWGCRYS
jgi:hypothetical protein